MKSRLGGHLEFFKFRCSSFLQLPQCTGRERRRRAPINSRTHGSDAMTRCYHRRNRRTMDVTYRLCARHGRGSGTKWFTAILQHVPGNWLHSHTQSFPVPDEPVRVPRKQLVYFSWNDQNLGVLIICIGTASVMTFFKSPCIIRIIIGQRQFSN